MYQRASIRILAGAALLAPMLFLGVSSGRPSNEQSVLELTAQKQPKTKPPAQKDAGKEAVVANVRAFTEAFNKRDVQAILKLFADDCVLTEADGSTTTGLKALEEELTDTFKLEPKAQISCSIDSLQVISPDVIIEEGKTTFFPDGKTLTAETEYQATHVKRGDRWVMTRVRSFNRVVLSPYDSLRDLEWLVGDWVDESDDSVVESSYRWDKNKTFLLHDFSVRANGKHILTGTQRIGRDPLTKQIKAWVFDSQGGYAESLWSATDEGWVMKANGVNSEGKVVSVTNQLTPIGTDRYRFDAVDRVTGGERMPGVSIVVVRRPPDVKK